MNREDDFRLDPDDELAKRIAHLINGYNLRSLTPEEDIELDDWVTTSMRNQQLFEELTDPANLKKWMGIMENLDREAALEKIKSRIRFEPAAPSVSRWKSWKYWTAAAVLAGIILTADYWLEKKAGQQDPIAKSEQDLPAGGRHAMLKLANGTNILLDTVREGRIMAAADLQLMKDSSGLHYDKKDMTEKKNVKALYDLISTPVAGEFQFSLSDGTKVWLNASSSLKYPENFSDPERKVELTGEGYFEVAKDAAHPFIVSMAGHNEVRVLGTHFNINSYADNSETVVTLAEGSVKLNGTAQLKPAQQGSIEPGGKIEVGPADLETALAWKNGQFIFKMIPLQELMRQASQWYDAKIIYQDTINEHFNARIPRNVPASKLLHLLEATGRVHFKIEDRTITVMK